MKIISWNCNGGFRNKFQALEKFNADIWIIQESESPDYLKEKISLFLQTIIYGAAIKPLKE